MKYKEVNGWEIYGDHVNLLKDGKVVDILYIDDLIEEWLKKMADKEFSPKGI